ncbi:MAG: hypothetical protein E7295_01155 [Lachnospiraceae bacterium]|jgi:hypothetical protein|nr:hypothetical protein [Lachnospiraceae bacterium]
MTDELVMHMQYESELLITLNVALFLILSGLIIAVLADPYLKKGHRALLLGASLLVGSLVVQGQVDTYLGMYKISRLGRTLAAMYGYQVRPLVIVLFIRILDLERKRKWIWIPVIINAMVYATALFSGIAFWFTQEVTFMRGPLGYCCHVVSVLLLLYLLWLSIRKFGYHRRLETAIPIGITAVIVSAIVIDYFMELASWVSFLTVSMVCSCLFFYLWLHLQFAREHERALKAEQEVQIMIAQVQPHFLYNVLSTIQALCKANPDMAYGVTEKFGRYLKENMDTLKSRELIPFKKELEHTKTYAELEMAKYPNFRLEIDAKEVNFLIPALSLQPIIENALQSDERIREQGLIRVSSSCEGDVYEIIVWDNGSGFQQKSDHENDPFHIGIQNVRERIESMCGGSMEVETFPNDGTIVTIKIPVKAGTKVS